MALSVLYMYAGLNARDGFLRSRTQEHAQAVAHTRPRAIDVVSTAVPACISAGTRAVKTSESDAASPASIGSGSATTRPDQLLAEILFSAANPSWTASNHLAIDWLTVPVLVALLPCCHCLGHHAGRLPSDCCRVNANASLGERYW